MNKQAATTKQAIANTYRILRRKGYSEAAAARQARLLHTK